MTAGEGIKKGAEGAKNVTEKSVDAVGAKVNEITTTVSDALGTAAEKIHAQAGEDAPRDK